GRDAVNAHALAGCFGGERLRHTHQRGFRSSISHKHRPWRSCSTARDIYDPARTARKHFWQNSPHKRDRYKKVDAHRRFKCGEVCLPYRPNGSLYRRIIDEDIDGAELPRGQHDGCCGLWMRKITDKRMQARSVFRGGLRRLRQRLLVATHHQHINAGAGEFDGYESTKSAACAGYNCKMTCGGGHALTSMLCSRIGEPFIGLKPIDGESDRLTDAQSRQPAKSTNAACIEINEGNIANPAAIAAGIGEARGKTEPVRNPTGGMLYFAIFVGAEIEDVN